MIQKNIVNDVMDEVELEDAKLRYIEIIKGLAIFVISSKKELILVNFVSQILPYIQPSRKYMYQSDIASASGQGQIMV
jgi:hypothetical protein